MNITELENKAREVCPKWLQDEVDEMLGNIKHERESDPDSWGDDWNFFEVLDFFEGSDWGKEHRFKLALTKINRHIGVCKKLGKGEEVMTWSSTGTKWLREGDWHFDTQWHDLLTECVA
tara:strand:+ start:248 stop:604 length:357 start_codon:yes stop_codon:yes gene_type:complete